VFFKDGPDVRIPGRHHCRAACHFARRDRPGWGRGRPRGAGGPSAHRPVPASSALAPFAYVDSTITVNGAFLVGAGETLTLANCTVYMNPSFTPEFGIFVAGGGTLIVNNSSIRSAIAGQNFTFEILGSARIDDSLVIGLWGDRDHVDDDGGIEIYSDDVVIRHSQIQGGISNTLMIRNASPRIEDNVITGAHDDCVELHNTTARVVNNTVRECAFGFTCSAAAPEIHRKPDRLQRARKSPSLAGSPVIEGNTFTANRNYAIRYYRTGARP